MLRPTVPPVIVLIAGALLVGCLPDYFPRRPLRGISESEVVGAWKLTRSAPPAAWSDDGGVEFFPGGKCTLKKFAHGDNESSGDYTWRITVEDGSKASTLCITGFGPPERPLTTFFYFTRHHGKLVLWQYVGDPDSREYIEYERI